MYFVALSALALAVTGTQAFEDSSPLFLYSTADFIVPSIPELSSASSVQPILSDSLSKCPTTNYFVVQQPGVSSDDYVCPKSTPYLRERFGAPGEGHTSLIVRDVVDTIDIDKIVTNIAQSCGKEMTLLNIDTMSFPEPDKAQMSNKLIYIRMPSLEEGLSTEGRKVILQNHDNVISSLVENYFDSKDYTIIYATQSMLATREWESMDAPQEYDAEIPLADILHGGELRRRSLDAREGHLTTNQTIIDGPLFDRYQFLSPGIFMGGLVGIILLLILYVGISALTSLQVTYGAFDKEQGQLAGKKTQ